MVENNFREISFLEIDAEQLVDFWENNEITLSPTDNVKEILFARNFSPELFLIYQDKEGIASTCWGTYDGRRGYIAHLCVRKNLRSTGLGKTTLEKVEKILTEKYNCYKIHLFVENTNKKVVPFYQKLGYVVRNELTMMSKTLRKK